MSGKSNFQLKPEKIEGELKLANKKVSIGRVVIAEMKSAKDLNKAVKKLSGKKIFSLPSYLVNE